MAISELTMVTSKSIPDWFEWLAWAFDDCSNPQRRMICVSVWVLRTERNKASSGIVARNRRERVIASRATIYENVDSAFAAEAHACLEAVKMGLEMKEHKIFIEGDSISVIRKCTSKSRDKSEICSIIHDIKTIQREFKSIKFQHVHRTASNLADIIATESLKDRNGFYLEGA
ncbi:hypothetical protein Goarm_011681, partial [Gossypium armourianum]|nr:hypothetical protein [Gossypium armourianum]